MNAWYCPKARNCMKAMLTQRLLLNEGHMYGKAAVARRPHLHESCVYTKSIVIWRPIFSRSSCLREGYNYMKTKAWSPCTNEKQKTCRHTKAHDCTKVMVMRRQRLHNGWIQGRQHKNLVLLTMWTRDVIPNTSQLALHFPWFKYLVVLILSNARTCNYVITFSERKLNGTLLDAHMCVGTHY